MLTMEAYLDNSATTRCSEAAKNKMVEALMVDFCNLWTLKKARICIIR